MIFGFPSVNLWAVGIVGCSILSIAINHPFVVFMLHLGIKLRLSLCAMLYRKVRSTSMYFHSNTTLSSRTQVQTRIKSATTEGFNGKVINLMSTDLNVFDKSFSTLHSLWKGPIELVIFGYFIHREIGIYGWIGVGFIVCFVPIQSKWNKIKRSSSLCIASRLSFAVWMGKLMADCRLKLAKQSDHRIKLMNEIIHGIQVIKMYVWEESFAVLVDHIRK